MASFHGRRPKIRIPASTFTPKKFCYDDETGELVAYRINDETGEPSIETQIPLNQDGTAETSTSKQYFFGKSKKLQALKDNIKAGVNTTSYSRFEDEEDGAIKILDVSACLESPCTSE